FELYIAQTPTEPGCDRLAVTVENGAVTAAVLVQEEWRDRSVTTEYLWREGAWQPLNTGLTPTERELVCLRAQTNWRPPFARQSRILGYERLVPESPFGAQAARITWRDAQTVFGAPYVVCYELDADSALVAARDESPNDNLGSWQLLLRGEEAAEVFAALSAQPFAPAV
ncbi:MAG: hypothetical protein IJ484_04915, partial [Oscillospiraceae bacterium]|nr:hypothetical protein [Oscillospiraceae bacterium]